MAYWPRSLPGVDAMGSSLRGRKASALVSRTRRVGGAAATALVLAVLASAAGGAPPRQPSASLATVERLADADSAVRRRAAELLLAGGDRTLVAPLVDQLFFTPPLL